MLALWKKSYDKPRQRIKKHRHYFANKGVYSQNYDFFSVVMYGCESWIIKIAECQRIDAFELWCWRRLLKVPWNVRTSNQSILKEINPEYSLEGWMMKLKPNTLATWWEEPAIGKDPNAGKDWRQKEKRVTENEMVRWHHWLSGHEFEQAPGVGDGQGSLVCCSPWSRKESDTTTKMQEM